MRRVRSRERAKKRACWRPREGRVSVPPVSRGDLRNSFVFRPSFLSPRAALRKPPVSLPSLRKHIGLTCCQPAASCERELVRERERKSAGKVSFWSLDFSPFFSACVLHVRGSIKRAIAPPLLPPRAPPLLRPKTRSRIEMNRIAKDSHTEGRGLGGLGADRRK